MSKILLHICCGPCATASIKKLLAEGYEVVGFYYNPNIHPADEYQKRLVEAKKLAKNLDIELIIPEYRPTDYFKKIGMENAVIGKVGEGLQFPEPKERCPKCWELRLEETAKKAKELGIGEIGSTLRISPYQNQEKLLQLGNKIAEVYDQKFYQSDLVSCYRESINISKEQEMYRQKYCGCIFSRDYL